MKKDNDSTREPLIMLPTGGGGHIPIWVNPSPSNPSQPPNITPTPSEPSYPPPKEEMEVDIKSVYEDKFVVTGYFGYLYAIAENKNPSGRFKLITDVDKVKIRVIGGDFIRLDERGFLIADTNKKSATKFNIYRTNKNEYVIQAPNGYYVRVREKDKILIANADKMGPRTIFKFRNA